MKKIINKFKRGFTIVELVIVIAVIAILAAVLIPTLSNVLNSAEESNDMVLVSNINTIVSSYGTVGEIDKVTTQDDSGADVSVYNITTAIEAISANGYDVSKLTPTSDSGDIVYNASTNTFLYYTDDFTELTYGTEPKTGDVLIVIDSDLQRVALAQSSSLLSDLTVQYCVYTTYDTGANIDNSNITVWLYTEGGSVTISLADGTVYHYGEAEAVTIKEVATESYHLYGKVEEITLEKGHVELAESAVCTTVTSTSEIDTIITVVGEKNIKLNGTFAEYKTKTSDTAAATKLDSAADFATATGAALEGTEANPYEISSEDGFAGMSSTINSADSSLTTVYLKLVKSLDMNNASSTAYAKLENTVPAVLDLNGNSVKAKTNSQILLIASAAGFTIKDDSEAKTGTIYAENSTKTTVQFINFTVKNASLTLESGNIYSYNCTWTNALIYLGGSTTGNTFTMNGGSISVEDTTINTGAVIKLAQDSVFTMNNDSKISVDGCTINGGATTKSSTYYNDNAVVGLSKTSTFVFNSGSISATNSTIYNGLVSLFTNGLSASDKTTFTMNGGTLTADSTVKATDNSYTPAVAVYNKTGKPIVTISGGTISAYNYCIAGNGDFTSSESTITIEAGSKLTSTTDFAIYNPQPGTVNVTGGEISGGAGAICMNRGTLNISGGTLVCEDTGNTGDYTSGTGTVTNAVINLGAKYAAVTCTITGGTLTTNGSAKVITIGTSASTYNVTLSVSKVTVNSTEYTAINDAYVTVADGYTLSGNVYTYSES